MSITKTNRGLRAKSLYPKSLFSDEFFNNEWPVDLWDDNGFKGDWIPAANIKETKKKYKVELTTPGYTKSDIKVEVDAENILHVTGEQKKESKEEKKNYKRREFSYGSFNRSFSLPKSVDGAKISAKCKDGVLNIHLPKKPETVSKSKAKEIKIS